MSRVTALLAVPDMRVPKLICARHAACATREPFDFPDSDFVALFWRPRRGRAPLSLYSAFASALRECRRGSAAAQYSGAIQRLPLGQPRLNRFELSVTARTAALSLAAFLAMSAAATEYSGQGARSGSALLPSVIRVGPGRLIQKVSEAATLARNGDLVLIDPGDYVMDVASWAQNDLVIRAVRCCARLRAQGSSSEGKAIWVVKGDNVTIENIEFRGARARDRNGAGIRHEGRGSLVVRKCRFTDNEMGILVSNNPQANVLIEKSEFDHNGVEQSSGRGGPIGHQIYVGRVATFTLRDSYVHDGAVGHLVKSRARESYIAYNRLTDEQGGTSSYELEFPDGGEAHVLANLIEQAPGTQNRTIVSYGAESLRWPRNELHLVNNTVVNDATGGRFVYARPGTSLVRLVNNIWVGPGVVDVTRSALIQGNYNVGRENFAWPAGMDYRLKSASPLIGRAIEDTSSDPASCRPEREYVHPMSSRLAPTNGICLPGAFEALVP